MLTEKQQGDEMEREEAKRAEALKKDNLSGNNDDEGDEFANDKIELPSADELKDELNHLPEADMNMLGNPETNPALKGDVVLTIFDLCIPAILKSMPEHSTVIKSVDKAFEIVGKFLNLIDKFPDLNREYLYLHILNYLQKEYPEDLRTTLIDVTLPIRGVNVASDGLAASLQLSVNKFIAYKRKFKDATQKDTLTNMFVNQLNSQFFNDNEQPSEKVDTLLKAIIKKCRTI